MLLTSPTTNKILSRGQAQAVYRTMLMLNKVGGLINAKLDDAREVIEYIASEGSVVAIKNTVTGHTEPYPGQGAFAAAYGIH